jgi:hypothetical protein
MLALWGFDGASAMMESHVRGFEDCRRGIVPAIDIADL